MDIIRPIPEQPEQWIEAVLRENHARLARVARHYAGVKDAADLLQEIALQLWRSRDSFDGRAERSTWVYRIALNTAISWRRRRPRDIDAGHAIDPDRQVGSTGPGDELALLEEFLDTLDPVNRAVLMMDLDGMTREQIADVLGLSAAAIAVRMTRLRQAFEQRYLENM